MSADVPLKSLSIIALSLSFWRSTDSSADVGESKRGDPGITVSSGDLVGDGSVVTCGWIKVDGGGARDLGEGSVLEVTTTCFTGGLDDGVDTQLLCKDSTYHLGFGSVGGGVLVSFVGDLFLKDPVGRVIGPTGLGILEIVATDAEVKVIVS